MVLFFGCILQNCPLTPWMALSHKIRQIPTMSLVSHENLIEDRQSLLNTENKQLHAVVEVSSPLFDTNSCSQKDALFWAYSAIICSQYIYPHFFIQPLKILKGSWICFILVNAKVNGMRVQEQKCKNPSQKWKKKDICSWFSWRNLSKRVVYKISSQHRKGVLSLHLTGALFYPSWRGQVLIWLIGHSSSTVFTRTPDKVWSQGLLWLSGLVGGKISQL